MNIFGYRVRGPNAYVIYLGMRAIAAFAFSLIITYELVYHTIDVGLNPLQLVTVGVTLESIKLLFEIPTGVVADSYSRRLSVLIGFFLTGIGFLFEGLVTTFTAVLTAQVLWGLGITFYSGAGEAWITDEIGENRAVQAFLRGTQLSQVTSLVGVITGAFLVSYGLTWPIIIGASIFLVLAAVLAWTMPESGYQPLKPKPDQDVLTKMLLPFQEGVQLVKGRPILMTILLVGIVIGLYVGGFDRLYAAHLTQDFVLPPLGTLDPVAWFSILSGFVGLLSLVSTEVVRRRLDVTSNTQVARLLFILYSGMIICTLIFALTQWFYVSVICFCISQSLRNTGRPLLLVWINQNTESRVRATVISMYWQSNALGQIAGSPIIGWIGARFSIRVALTVGALIYLAILPLLRRASNTS